MNKPVTQLLSEEFDRLAEELKETHEVMPSCNNDISRYLVPKGTSNQVTYYGKPEGSFRISDHWSWYANVKKCADEAVIQCELDGLTPNNRKGDGLPSDPVTALAIAVYRDGKYYPVYVAGFSCIECFQ